MGDNDLFRKTTPESVKALGDIDKAVLKPQLPKISQLRYRLRIAAFRFDAEKPKPSKPGINRSEHDKRRAEGDELALHPKEFAGFDERFAEGIPATRVETFSKFVDLDPKNQELSIPVNVPRSRLNTNLGESQLSDDLEDLRIKRKLIKERGQEETFGELFVRKFGAHVLDKSPAGKEPKRKGFSQGVISLENARKLARMDVSKLRLAIIKPMIRKKKKGRIIKKIDPNKNAMQQIARTSLADRIVDQFEIYIKKNPNLKGVNGVFDEENLVIRDATKPEDAIWLQNKYKAGNRKIGINSITDTRTGPNTDINRTREELRAIEQSGGTPALGFDEGSLEANQITFGRTDEDIVGKLLDSQNSTGILDPDTKFHIEPNPKLKKLE